MAEQSNAFLDWSPVAEREMYELEGTPFVIELQEITDGTALFELDRQREGRVKGRGAMKAAHGLAITEAMATWLTWLEGGCVGIYERDAEGELHKVADGITYLQACQRTKVMKDRLIAAGIRACLLTQGPVSEKKGPTSETSTDSSESTE